MNNPEPEEKNVTDPMFFGVSTFKMVLMSFLTLSLYNFYWFYKNFDLYEKRYNEGSIPILRALFSPIFSFALFASVNAELENRESSRVLPAAFLAIVYFLLNASGRLLPEPYFLISFLAFIPLISANNRINNLNALEDENYDPDDDITWVNWIFLLTGTATIILMVFGLIMGVDA